MDTAAGELLVIEAGGLVTDFVGGHNHTESGNIVAASTHVLREMLKDIRPHLGDSLSNKFLFKFRINAYPTKKRRLISRRFFYILSLTN